MKHPFIFGISFILSIFLLAGCSSFIQDLKTISEPLTFTVTFNSNCNNEFSVHGTMDPQLFTEDKPQPLSKNKYTSDNYAYIGWADEPSATEVLYKDEELFTAVEDTTLYAVWAKPNYKIIYQFKKLDGTGYDEQTVLCYGEPGTKTSVTAPEFVGFTPENFDQIEIDHNPDTIQEIRITYNRNKYTISFLHYGECIGEMDSIEALYQESITLPDCTFTNPDVSQIFAGWAIDAEETQVYYPDDGKIEVTENLSLYAMWMNKDLSRYKVTHHFQNIDDDGYTENEKFTQSLWGYYDALTEASPLDVYGFTAESFEQVKIVRDADPVQEIPIKYTRNVYTITFDHNGDFDGTKKSITARYQEEVPLPDCEFCEFTIHESRKFAGWSEIQDKNDDIEFIKGETIEVTRDMDLYAHSEPNEISEYMVRHYFQKLSGDGYSEDPHIHRHQIFEGYDGHDTEAEPLTVTGFKAKSFEQKKIEDDKDGLKTYVDIYYDRIPVTLTFNLAGGTMTYPVLSEGKLVLRYGAAVPTPVVEKTDHKLTSWTPALPSVALEDGSYTAGWEESYTYIPGAEGGLDGTTTKRQGSIAKASIRGLPNTSEIYVVPKGTVAKINTDGSSIWGLGSNLGTEEAHVHGAFYPQREIELSPYIISQYPVTVELCESIMRSYGYTYTFDDSHTPMQPYESDPANGISWYNAVSFCNLLSDAEGLEPVYYYIDTHGIKVTNPKFWPIGSYPEILGDNTKNGYRLPTNAEWEFAARGGNPSDESWHYSYSGAKHVDGAMLTTKYDEEDANLSTVAYYKWNINRQKGPCTVGQWKPNRLGLYDMSGGICEWTYDYYSSIQNFNNVYDPYLNAQGIVVDPRGTEKGLGMNTPHSLRGGSYFSSPFYCTVTYILLDYAYKKKFSYGLRLCRNAE